MHVNRGLLGWGVFFVVVGAVPLAVQAGIIDESAVVRAWQLWPLILIGAGLGLVLARTRAGAIGGLIVAVTAGLMVGGLVAGGVPVIGNGISACNGGIGGGDRTAFPDQTGTLGSDAQVSVELDCGSVDISSVAGSAWKVTGESPNGMPPELSSDAGRLSVSSPTARSSTIGFSNPGVAWTIAVPQDPRTRFDLTVNAGSGRASFDGMRLERVATNVNAGSAVLDLGAVTEAGTLDGSVNAGSLKVSLPAVDMRGTLTANAGSLQICAPAGVDLRITVADNTLGSNNFASAGLQQQGGAWVTPGYGSGSAQIDLTTSANLGSITLNPGGGCAD